MMKEVKIEPVYSIVIPVYNSNEVLVELCQRIENVFMETLKQSFEIILVDDGSANSLTWPRIEDLVNNSENICGIQLTKNFGQHAALICGMTYAKGKYIVTMDDDLQQLPEDICKFIPLADHDVVMGQFKRKRHSSLRNFGSYVKSYFDYTISGKPKGIRVSSYCLIHKKVAETVVREMQYPLPLFSASLFKATRDIVGVEVGHNKRRQGNSGYTLLKLARMFTRVFYKPGIKHVDSFVPFSVRTTLYKHQNLI